jgi:hypothetical protein
MLLRLDHARSSRSDGGMLRVLLSRSLCVLNECGIKVTYACLFKNIVYKFKLC